MNVMILGSGGREHALAWKVAQSPLCSALVIAPGNPGTAALGINAPLDLGNFEAVASLITAHHIDLLIVGPEAPLVAGIRDFLERRPGCENLRIIGPGRAGAMLEGSKDFSKQFMQRHGIPTAAYRTFSKHEVKEAQAFLETLTPPYVLKADGLAAGKGVLIIEDLAVAQSEIADMLGNARFGDASAKVVIEEFLNGVELSVFALTDGKDYALLPEAKDYKRIGEGDTGPNTGGMGAVSPVPFANKAFMEKVVKRIVEPTVSGLQMDSIPYVGFIFFGLINVKGDPFVIEYNARMGDPETEVVVPRIASDFLQLLVWAADGALAGKSIDFDARHTATVMTVSGGYPGEYEKGKRIALQMPSMKELPFHAGTAMRDGALVTAGGRVLACSAFGESMTEAIHNAYSLSAKINFEGMYYRKDIGKDLLEKLT